MPRFTHNSESAAQLDQLETATQEEQPVDQDQLETHAGDTLPDKPDSHPHIDAETITKDGLIKACSFFAEAAKRNPQLADAQAERAITVVKEDAALREKGLDGEAIKSQKWASMRDRHKEKTQTEQPETAITKQIDPLEQTQIRLDQETVTVSITAETPRREEQVREVIDEMSLRIPAVESIITLNAASEEERIEQETVHRHHQDELAEVVTMVPADVSDIIEKGQATTSVSEALAEDGMEVHAHISTDEETAPEHLQFFSDVEIFDLAEGPSLPSTDSIEAASTYTEIAPSVVETVAPIIFEVKKIDMIPEEYEPETTEVYTELIASMPSETMVIVIEDIPELPAVYKAETTAEPVTLEIIQEKASLQPLEETLQQFIQFVAETKDPETHPEIGEILQAIETALYKHEPYSIEGKKSIVVTPELALHLMTLLRLLGYEEPKEVLADYLNTHGLESLLRALITACSLYSNELTKEVLTPSVIASIDDQSVRERVAKLIFGLISRPYPGSDLAS